MGKSLLTTKKVQNESLESLENSTLSLLFDDGLIKSNANHFVEYGFQLFVANRAALDVFDGADLFGEDCAVVAADRQTVLLLQILKNFLVLP